MMRCILFLLLFFTGNLGGSEHFPVIILGGGISGLTAATYLARGGITPLVLTGNVGGIITTSHDVQNWPGEISISGALLAEKIEAQAKANGVLMRPEWVISVDFSKHPFEIVSEELFGDEKKRYEADAVIIASGAVPNRLGVEGEETYQQKGVYSCAVCDGTLYKDQIVAVIGGGDSALIEAEYLSRIAKEVHVLVRKEKFRAVDAKRLQSVISTPNIQVHYATSVRKIVGDGEKVTDLELQNGEKLSVNALFLAIGSQPNTRFLGNALPLDSKGYILLKTDQETGIPGVYAVGDVSDPKFKQAVSAAGDGAKAALQAQRFLATLETRGVIPIRSVAQFDQEVSSARSSVYVDFYSTHCPPCRTLAPVFEKWAESKRGKFLKVNGADVPELFHRYQIRGVPTLLVMDQSGKVIRKAVGMFEIKQLEKDELQ
ncbi:MAG: FAD-dependent oxidoreductase [Verrucomicrobia bacterium]|nr:FAD-dependent oxidoreductase [Verrucomicrobiota bacterium]